MNKRFRASIAMLVVAALAAACGATSPGTGASPAGSAAATVAAPITLQFASFAWQKATVDAHNKIVADWNAKNPNITVKIVTVDVNSVHDKLLTTFQGGTAADIVHDESADIGGFAGQGFLADLSSLIPGDLKADIPQGIWDTVTFNKKIAGVPTILQTYSVFVNKKMLADAKVELPTAASPWTWDKFAQVAKQLTTTDRYGVGWGLKSPAATVMSMSLNFNGNFFYNEGGKNVVKFGTAEQQVLKRIYDLAYTDKSLSPTTLGQSGPDILPGFFAGKYAMIVGGNYVAQQMVEQAPAGFDWAMLPLLKGDSQAQSANPQTLSIAAQSKNPKEAMQFIAFYMQSQNLASVAIGDWLIPVSTSAGKAVTTITGGKNSWDVNVASTPSLRLAPFQTLDAYPQWKSQIAQPAFQQYFANKIDLATVGTQLTEGWTKVGGK
ncbi:MAG TPA: sugar ABC transporter substrate-binding protein [Candidatus Limnocylindria bacterium]|jgi:ABC-type glycerol-3-phosphate transport system substrate-binding protein|nr:sugar ABC transporter substrate-binding protein [Candidatus Limnocylindria bacterium]